MSKVNTNLLLIGCNKAILIISLYFSTKYLFPSHTTVHAGAASLRAPLESLVEETCPTKKVVKRKLTGEY